jgi:CRP-like cAMP-binding protein
VRYRTHGFSRPHFPVDVVAPIDAGWEKRGVPAEAKLPHPDLPAGNRLLARLSGNDFTAVAPHLERIPLELGCVLATAGEDIVWVYFPETSVIGFAEVLSDGQRLAVALAGREGMAGWPLLLGNDRWPHEVIVRAEAGTALRIEAGVLRTLLSQHAVVRTIMLRYISSLTSQIARTLVSNLIHPIDRRTARWLLLYHDRIEGDEVMMTHEEMGVMLGVRRSSITDALHQLEGFGAIKGHRGRILIRDRAKLEELAGETYGTAEREYERLLVHGLVEEV